ncbi:MAG: hypothetical protein JNK67_19655 [Alphaproteobacteria bacterium]|nr:hypothetical protein [Alphaproteobacteria bacterium]
MAAALLLAAGLGACADADPAYDPIELSRSIRQGVGRLLRDDPAPAAAPADPAPPPDEGRPYPNLASVPTKPQRVVATARDGEIDALTRDRVAAEGRAQALREGGDPGAGEQGGRFVGRVAPDAAGRFSAEDERRLREAAGLARQRGGRIRLQGEVRAALAAADRLGSLGIVRDRIDLVPAPQAVADGGSVEIMVASGPAGR